MSDFKKTFDEYARAGTLSGRAGADQRRIEELEATCAALREALKATARYFDALSAWSERNQDANDVHRIEEGTEPQLDVTLDDALTAVQAALATDAGKAVLDELTCLRAALGFMPLSLREAVRLGDVEKCAAWAAEGEAFKARLQEQRAEFQDRAEKAERERDGAKESLVEECAESNQLQHTARRDALTEMSERAATAAEVGRRWLGRGAAAFEEVAAAIRALPLEET